MASPTKRSEQEHQEKTENGQLESRATREATVCVVCGVVCDGPLTAAADGAHLWFVPRHHGFPNISGNDESCAKCGKMRGPVNESRPCPGVQHYEPEDWFR